MNKKWISVLTGFLVIASLLAGVSCVSAQTGSLPVHPSQSDTPLNHATTTSTAPLSALAALSLGKTGTSFRYADTIGVTNEAYVSDWGHLNSPNGVYIDATDHLYVAEINGQRVVKYDSDGTGLLEFGVAGVPWAHENYLTEPRDSTVDSNGNIWVVMAHAIKQFDASGDLLQILPADDPWATGEDNSHFNIPQGIAFDNSGLLYVADSANQRIQIFNVSGGTPVYQGTIGATGQARSDNSGFDWPHRIAFDSLNRLYVADEANFRVQRCTYTTDWICETFFGVTDEYGTDASHLGYVYGLEIHGDSIFIADTSNYRVLKCDLNANCSNFAGEPGVSDSDNDHFMWPTDVAVDSAGNAYVADEANARVQIFDSTGAYKETRGVTSVPYVVDDIRLNTPWGVSKANDGGLLVTENLGRRLIKYDSNMVQQWAFGTAGVGITENANSTIEGKAAQDAAGKIYVPDTWDHQVIILSEDGQYLGALGTIWEAGEDNAHFNCPHGVAVSPVNQDIYVVDSYNQRIQVFTQALSYKATLGVTGEVGSDVQHFNNPRDVVVDAIGNVYVADSGNYRVQKCTLSESSYSCTTLVGETGVFDNAFNHFYPESVTIDRVGNVYVADDWNSRVQVYDNAGKYLTTIAGSWGISNSQLSSAMGVAVDKDGMVYVADRSNNRIQQFAPGYPNWKQANLNGFGDRRVEQIPSFAVFNNELYAGAWLWNGEIEDSQVWRTSDGATWEMVGSGFGNGASHMAVFNNKLFVGTWDGNIFSSSTGTDWTQVITNGFENTGQGIARFQVYNGQLYASTWSDNGTQVWRTSNGTNWTKFNTDGFGDPNYSGAPASIVYKGLLYYGAGNWTNNDGAQLWRTDGTAWTQIVSDGFGDPANRSFSSMAVFKDTLYACLSNDTSTRVYRSENGTDWTSSIESGLNSPNNNGGCVLQPIGDALYIVLSNEADGIDTWKTQDGKNWIQIGQDGFGDNNNIHLQPSAAIGFNGKLFVGADNFANGGEIWSYDTIKRIFIPMVMR